MPSTTCGPSFFPGWLRNILFGWFFEASCIKHDKGYGKGGSEVDRLYYDTKFLMAMLRDTVRTKKAWFFPKLIVAIVWFVGVRALGWITFKYNKGIKK